MLFNYPKIEKLKSKKIIDSLFVEGKSVSKYPLRLVFMETPESDFKIKIGVSVSKKYFKNAVDRNYYKRVLRECYRKNKSILIESFGEKKFSIMFFYQTKDRLSYDEINQKTIELFIKFNNALNQENKTN
jgi:ribonuclease P protein component